MAIAALRKRLRSSTHNLGMRRRLPELNFIDDRAGEPISIQSLICRRPIAAFGDSDGDFQRLEWTTSGPGARFGLCVHHDAPVAVSSNVTRALRPDLNQIKQRLKA